MCSFDTVLVILKRKNLSQRALASYLNVGETAVAAWKAGRSDGWQKRLPEIADYLGVTVDELLGKPLAYDPQLDALNSLILALDAEDRATLARMAEAMLGAPKYKKGDTPAAL